MIVQSSALLGDVDKELNNLYMRAREWYGWHFPELGKIITDNLAYVKVILTVGKFVSKLFWCLICCTYFSILLLLILLLVVKVCWYYVGVSFTVFIYFYYVVVWY